MMSPQHSAHRDAEKKVIKLISMIDLGYWSESLRKEIKQELRILL